MNKRGKISHNLGVTAMMAAMLLSYACSKSGILSKNDVADIMFEMFLTDEYAKKYGWNLIVESNMEAFNAGVGPFTHGSKVHTDLMKTKALQ